MILRGISKLFYEVSGVRYFSDVRLTSERYNGLIRGLFNKIEKDDIDVFRGILGNSRVITDEDNVKAYNVDWMRAYRGQSKVVLRPKSVEEVSAIVKHCNRRLLAIVPQGGNTGLVGGSVPVFDEIIVSMSLMNKINHIDDIGGTVVCEAGVILESLEMEVNKHNLCIPLDLGAKGSCQIGGNVSTNAGGIRLLRYGSLHANVLGIKVVLPDGEILDCLTSLRKDNTGYDLKQLFIGAEGTLGIVTDVCLLCPPKPKSVNVAYLGCSNFNEALETLKLAKLKLGEILSAFELMDKESISSVVDNLGFKSPLSSEHEFHILVETSGSNEDHDQEKLNNFLNDLMETGCVQDGIVAQDIAQIRRVWEIRENIATAMSKLSFWFLDDVSIPLTNISDFVESMKICPKSWKDVGIKFSFFGHVGDGNLHLNIVTPEFCPDLNKRLELFVYTWLQDNRGSISAEHGLGLKKSPYLHYSKTDEAIKQMKKIKSLFDPNGIMNPYKFFH